MGIVLRRRNGTEKNTLLLLLYVRLDLFDSNTLKLVINQQSNIPNYIYIWTHALLPFYDNLRKRLG